MIDVFERAGYRIYAEIVKNTIYAAESDSDSSDYDEPIYIPQPETYPHHKLSPPSSPTVTPSPRKLSAYDEYLLINPATAQGLPEGKYIILL